MKNAVALFSLVVFVSVSAAQASALDRVKNLIIKPVSAAGLQVQISWTPSTSPNAAGVKILRRSGGPCPSGALDASAVQIYDGSGSSATDTAVAPATTYCYAAYTHDNDLPPAYSSGVTGTILTPSVLAATAKASPSSGSAPLTVIYSAVVTGGKTPYALSWVINGQPPEASPTVTKTWSTPGSYPATLTVTDANLTTATSSVNVTVGAAGPPLSATASASPINGVKPLAVNFTATAAGGTAPYTYAWDFKDGQSSTQANPAHTFVSAGTYDASLTVTDATSGTATATASVTVTNTPPPGSPSVSITATPTSGSAPLTVTFAQTVSGGTSPYSYSWDFGDSQTSTQANPSHDYSAPGSYTARLTATDASGATGTATSAITVSAPAGPAPVTSLIGMPGAVTSLLTWKNPAEPAMAGVKVFRKTGSAPTGPTDALAAEVYSGNLESFHDSGLTTGTAYGYAVYTYRDGGTGPIYSSTGPTATITPTGSFLANWGAAGRVTESGFAFAWHTTTLTDGYVRLFDSSGSTLLLANQFDAGDNEKADHAVYVDFPIQQNTIYRFSIRSTNSAGLTQDVVPVGILIGSYTDSVGNTWFGQIQGSPMFSAWGWNGTNSPLDVAKCDNTCNQFYACTSLGLADCRDPRNSTFNARQECGGLAIADCLDGVKDLPSGPTGALSAAALQSWAGTRLPDFSELKAVCSKIIGGPPGSSTWFNARAQVSTNRQANQNYPESPGCTATAPGSHSINSGMSLSISPP